MPAILFPYIVPWWKLGIVALHARNVIVQSAYQYMNTGFLTLQNRPIHHSRNTGEQDSPHRPRRRVRRSQEPGKMCRTSQTSRKSSSLPPKGRHPKADGCGPESGAAKKKRVGVKKHCLPRSHPESCEGYESSDQYTSDSCWSEEDKAPAGGRNGRPIPTDGSSGPPRTQVSELTSHAGKIDRLWFRNRGVYPEMLLPPWTRAVHPYCWHFSDTSRT